MGHARHAAPSNFVYITVSDGLGVGIVLGGELVRGQHNIAGEFGHVPLNIDGPRCGCGATGCWEAYVSNLATLSRYFGRDLRDRADTHDVAAMTIDDLIARARGGDAKALAALLSTARYLGLGLGSVVNAIDPAHVYIGGEITAAWDLIEATVRSALAERVLTPPAGATPITIVPPEQYPRLRGAAALVAAPAFAKGVRGVSVRACAPLRSLIVVLAAAAASWRRRCAAARRTSSDRRPEGRCRCVLRSRGGVALPADSGGRPAARARARGADDRRIFLGHVRPSPGCLRRNSRARSMVGGRDVVPLIARVGVIESANGSKAFAQLYAALALRHFGADLSTERDLAVAVRRRRTAWSALLDPTRSTIRRRVG